MGKGGTYSDPSDAEGPRPDLPLDIKYAFRGGLNSRRAPGQSIAWRTGLWVVLSTAVIFLVMKCTLQLSTRIRESARMLAEGSDDWGDQRQLLFESDSDDDGSPCGDGERMRQGNDSFLSKFRRSLTSRSQRGALGKDGKGKEIPAPNPSMSADVPEAGGDLTSHQDSTGKRIQHETQVFFGIRNAPHYNFTSKYYEFPQLGEGYKQLQTILKKLEKKSRGLCFDHRELYNKTLHADYVLKNGTRVTVHIVFIEMSKSHNQVDIPIKPTDPSGKVLNHHNFGRDVACITEEMLVEVLNEAENTGSGRLTRTVK